MRPVNCQILSAAANADQNSNPQWAQDIVRASFQAVVTGSTASGTLQLQFSNDQAVGVAPNKFVPTNWSNLGSSVSVAASGVYSISEVECSYEYLRLVWTDSSSGTNNGTVTARMKAQAL